MKTIMTALLLLLVIAQWNTASAQLSQGRLFAPMRSDQFGGNARLRDGVFGDISYNYWTITQGKARTIGFVDPNGRQNLYYDGNAFQYRTNTMSTGSLGNTFSSGTTLRIGNINKHHGWELKTTIMEPNRSVYQGVSGKMDIADDAVRYVTPVSDAQCWYYDFSAGNPDDKFLSHPLSGPGSRPNIQSGYLWGWFLSGSAAAGNAGDDAIITLAPLPLTFDRYKIESKISHWDVEANYIFRAHATRIGFFEFTGGVRYMQLDDTLTFRGWGMPWGGDMRIDVNGSYNGENIPMPPDEDTEIDITEYYLNNGELPGLYRNYAYSGTPQGVGTALSDSVWDFKAENHLVGPQVGVRYIRKCSGRWSLIADTKFFAGFNTQNIKSEGIIRSPAAEIDAGATGVDALMADTGILPWLPVGTMQSPGTFRHSETRTAFSPGIDFSLKANWQFTDAIAFNAGYQGMYLDKTARSSLINNYTIYNDGTIFGINEDVNQSTFMHGVSLGLSINRP